MEHKFICCSDTHAKLPPNLDDNGVTAWLHAGDVYDCGFRNRPPSSVSHLMLWLQGRQMPVYAVKGNHDGTYKHEFMDKCDANGRCIQLAPKLWLVGIGWSGGAYYDLPMEPDLESVCANARREITLKTMPGDKFIVLTHWPPLLEGVNPFHGNPVGWVSKTVGELVKEIKPIVVVQGHIHRWFGRKAVYVGEGFSTIILSPGPRGGYLYVDPEAYTAKFETTLKKPVEPTDKHGFTDFV